MSLVQIQPLGQVAAGETIEPQPITRIPEQVYGGLQSFWDRVRLECEEVFTPAQCQALLGSRPTILAPGERKEGLAWYWWVLIGIGIGKVIL